VEAGLSRSCAGPVAKMPRRPQMKFEAGESPLI
jgi:hypothetical protein